MSVIYKTVWNDKALLEVWHDNDVDPRSDFDNFGKMISFHRNYRCGDNHNYSDPDDFLLSLAYEITDSSSPDYEKLDDMDRNELLEIIQKGALIYPLYLYDHSIQSISMASFIGRAHHASWDSGQVGWVYVTHEDLIKEYGTVNEGTIEKATNLLSGEVKIYDHYLRGNTFGFDFYVINQEKIKKYMELVETDNFNDLSADEIKKFAEEVESIGGFYGDDFEENGMTYYVSEEYYDLIKQL